MANVSIKFNGKDFLLSCDDGQEEHLEELLIHINQKFNDLKNDLGNIGENKLLLITTIQLIDEYFDLKERVNVQKAKLDKLSEKFIELKSLAINYKDEKDLEINKLNLEIDNFRKMAEESNNLYESMLDRTTKSLEKIIENTGTISKVQ